MADRRADDPSLQEREAGYHMARFADQEALKKPSIRERCFDCAFRLGTDANTYGPTILNATKCALEREPFYCHIDVGADGEHLICAGWALMQDAGETPVQTPWEFVADESPQDHAEPRAASESASQR